jgi:hypothetical protein
MSARLLQPPLDLGLLVVRDLHALRAEELDAVVAIRVVRGRDDDRHVEPVPAHQHGCARCGQHAAEQRVPSAGGDAGRERGLEHLAGLARVADDQDLGVLGRRRERGGAPEPEGEIRGQEIARDAADPVGPEQGHAAF